MILLLTFFFAAVIFASLPPEQCWIGRFPVRITM
jgi:hypothetical protein